MADLRFEVEPSDGSVLGGVADSSVEFSVRVDLLLGRLPFVESLEPLLEELVVLKLALDFRRRSLSEEKEGIAAPWPCRSRSER